MANCKNTQQLNITCGTDVVLHDMLMFDDEVFDPNVSVDIECNLVNSLGKRTSLEYEIADEVLIIQIPWVDGRNAGCYGLEVKGKCNGKTWATYADSLIRYTRATVEGAAVVETEHDWYDVTQVVSYRYSDSPLDEVDATIDDNYGEPTVTTTYEHNKLTLDFKNLRGNGIASVEQTTVSTEDEGVNETTITQDNGDTTVMQVRNGRKGDKGDKGDTGDSAIFDPTTGNISEMKQTTGLDKLSPMSQKAVTDIFLPSKLSVEGDKPKATYDKDDCFVAYFGSSTTYDIYTASSDNGYRMRICRYVTKGTKITAQCSSGKGVAISLYAKSYEAIPTRSDYVQTMTNFEYTTDTVTGIVLQDSWMSVSLCKTDGTAFTAAQKTLYLAALNLTIEAPVTESITNIYDGVDDGMLLKSDTTSKTYNFTTIITARLIYRVHKGDVVKCSSMSTGLIEAALFDNFYDAFMMSTTNTLGSIHASTNESWETVIERDGFLCCSGKKSDGTAMSDAEWNTLTSAMKVKVIRSGNQKAVEKQVERINTGINGDRPFLTLGKKDCHILYYSTSYKAITYLGNDDDGNRIRVMRYVFAGTEFTAQCSSGKGVAASLYASLDGAFSGSSAYVQTFSYAYTTDVLQGHALQNGWLVVTLCKSDGSVFTSAEKASFVDALNLQIQVPISESMKCAYSMREKPILYGLDSTQYSNRKLKILDLQNVNRIRYTCNVKKGDIVKCTAPDGVKISASIFDEFLFAFVYGTVTSSFIINIHKNSFGKWEAVVPCDGILSMNGMKEDGSVFSSEEWNTAMSQFKVDVIRADSQMNLAARTKATEGFVEEETSSEMFVGSLVNKSCAADDLGSVSTTRTSSVSVIAVPYVGAALTAIMPNNYYFGIRTGNVAQNLSTDNSWYGSGDTFTLPSDARYYRLYFAKGREKSDTITAEEVMALVESGDIKIMYTDSTNVIKDNVECEKCVDALSRIISSTASADQSLGKLAVFTHTSDTHGDAVRVRRFLEYSDHLDVDAAIITGDMVAYNPNNGLEYVNDLAKKCKSKVLVCVGNHDARSLTPQQQYELGFGDLIERNESVINDEEAYPTYYYHDFASKKMRVISVNLYDTTHTGDNIGFSKAQCEWIINALATTPQDYGVMMLFHAIEDMTSTSNFHQSVLQYVKNHEELLLVGQVFGKLIDAFIGKTSVDITYTTSNVTYEVSADFSNVASGVEFVAFLNGHWHTDTIGYNPNTTHRQVVLNVPCGIGIYGTTYPYLANCSDMPRNGKGVTQDCFNVYAVDRVNKYVRIAKVGSTVASDLSDRKKMMIKYIDD